MIAQIDEHQITVVTLAVNPARNFDGLTNVSLAKIVTRVRAEGMHSWFSFNQCLGA